MKFLLNMDFLGHNVSFTHNGSNKIKTLLGGILYVIIIICSIVSFCFFGADLIEKKRPISRFTQKLTINATINFRDFPLSILFADRSGSEITEIDKFITLKPVLFYVEESEEKIKTRFKGLFYEKCTEFHYGIYKSLFSRGFSISSEPKCINPTKSIDQIDYLVDGTEINLNDSLAFNNEYASKNSAFFQLVISKCDEKRDKKQCASEEKINEILSEFYVVLTFVNYYVDLQKYDAPDIPILKSFTQMGSINTPKRNFLTFKRSEIHTDYGLIFENTYSNYFYQLEASKIDIFKSENDILIFTMDVSQTNEIYFRTYIKLQEVLARLGGIIKLFLIIGESIIGIYSKSQFLFELTNIFYQTENNQSISNVILQINRYDKINNHNFKQDYPRNHSVRLNYYQYVKSLFIGKNSNENYNYYNLAIKNLKRKFEITFFLKMMRKLDNLIEIFTSSEKERKAFLTKIVLNKELENKEIDLIDNQDEIQDVIKSIRKKIIRDY